MAFKLFSLSNARAALLCAMVGVSQVAAGTARSNPIGEAELSKLLAGRIPGKPADCIDLHSSDNAMIIDHTAIVYRDGDTLWVNRPKGNLTALDDNSIPVTTTFSSQLCSIDSVNLIDRTSRFERGFVVLSNFIPFNKPR